MEKEVYVSVDVEASGPIPGEYSLLSLGACVIDQPHSTFYAEFKPISEKFVPEALAVSGLHMEKLKEVGKEPLEAMREFKSWIEGCCGPKPVFVGFNASFDWSFVNYYFHRFLGENPFGFSALDIKAYFMGMTGSSWNDTRSSQIAKSLGVDLTINHNALQDALVQSGLFKRLLSQTRPRRDSGSNSD